MDVVTVRPTYSRLTIASKPEVLHGLQLVPRRMIFLVIGVILLSSCAIGSSVPNSYLNEELRSLSPRIGVQVNRDQGRLYGFSIGRAENDNNSAVTKIECELEPAKRSVSGYGHLVAFGLLAESNLESVTSALRSRYGQEVRPYPNDEIAIWSTSTRSVSVRETFESYLRLGPSRGFRVFSICLVDTASTIPNQIILGPAGYQDLGLIVELLLVLVCAVLTFRTRKLRWLVLSFAVVVIWTILIQSVPEVWESSPLSGVLVPYWTLARDASRLSWYAVLAWILVPWCLFGILGAVTISQKVFAGRWAATALVMILTGMLGLALFLVPLLVGGPITYYFAQRASGRVQCASCKSWVNDEATICPHCRSELVPKGRQVTRFSW